MDNLLIMENHSNNLASLMNAKSPVKAYQASIEELGFKSTLTKKILEKAIENDIPIHEDTELVKMLAKLDFVRSVPSEYYRLVGQIMTYIYKLDKSQKKMFSE